MIPGNPHLVPRVDTHQPAVDWFWTIAPGADGIEIKLNDRVQFFDCGANFERVICPVCEQDICVEWWQNRMGEDLEEGGFKLEPYPAPCCGGNLSLNELRYDWPQGFARFGLEAMNPDIGKLSDGQRMEFERILGTTVKVVYQHL